MEQNNNLSNKSKSPLLYGVKPRLIIGLGNPDKEYEKTYHNVGFLAIDFLIKNLQVTSILNSKSSILKSEVYMNESGSFVRKIIKQNNIKPEELLIIHDDSDIKIGEYKLSFGRSSAGHRGVQSIIDALKTKNFWRLRIGIRKAASGKRQEKRLKASDLVLKKISKTDMETLNKTFKDFLKCLK